MKNINNYLWFLTLPLLFAVLFLDIWEKNIVSWNILVFSIIIFYLLLWILYFLFPKIIKFPSYIDKEIIRNISKFVVLFVLSGIISVLVLIYFYQTYSGWLNLELRVTWKITFTYLWLALVISPIIKILKIKRFAWNLIMLRQIFWIYSFIFLLKHLLLYVWVEFEFYKLYSDNSWFLWYYIKNMSVRYDVILWTIAFIPMCLLWVSSNKLSVQFLGLKVWKSLHTLIYPTFILAMIHIAFAWKMWIYYASILCIVVILRLLAYFLNSKENGNLNSNTITKFTNSKNDWEYMKYICKVCWYIYDEKEWDPDWGLSPWTRFEDIPDDWVCPVCWVSKSDFEPLEQEKTINSNRSTLQLVSKNYLTRDVLKVWFKSENYLEYNSWQYVIFELNDKDWKFDRNYSIAWNDWYILFYYKIK